MRRWLIIASAVIGIIIVVLGYAFFNLGAIIEANRGYILARASAALGRRVEVAAIKAHLGWGVAIDLRDLKIADDPAFGQVPFVQAHNVYVQVSLLPLLANSLKLTHVRIEQPTVRVIRNRAGQFNFSTLGVRGAAGNEGAPPAPTTTGNSTGGSSVAQLQLPAMPATPTHGHAGIAVTIASFRIKSGTLSYLDERTGGPPLDLRGFDLTASDFRADSSFRLKTALAVLSDQPNLALAGEVGPLMHDGALVLDRVPLDLTATIGPFSLAQLRTLPALTRILPAALAVSAPATITAKVSGPVGALRLDARSDLGSSHIVYGGAIDKAAGIPLLLKVDTRRNDGRIELSRIELAVAGLSLTATDIIYAANKMAARFDSGHADLAKLAKFLTIARDYQLSGEAEVHAKVALAEGKPSATGSLVLSKINVMMPEGKVPPLTDLSGTIQMMGDTVKVGPLACNVGSSHARVTGNVASFEPLETTYQVALDTLKLGEFIPSRQALGEQMTQVAASGNLRRNAGNPTAATRLTSAAGVLGSVPYQNLALNASWGGNQLTIDSLNVAAFDGSLEASGSAILAAAPKFDLQVSAHNIDLQKALESQKAMAAATIRGRLTGRLQVFGAGAKFDQIRPTLSGAGRATIDQGKLVGVNVVAQALGKVNNLPGIGALVPAEVVSRHPELFKSPDTAIDQASLTFTLQGPRLTSHDINARTADYTILGDGWFDMDKQLDLAARILLSPAFSSELVSARRGVAYLENSAHQVEIPLRITGQMPKPLVAPDVPILIQRASTKALEGQLGKLLGGSSRGGDGAPSKPKNPLDQLKNLFR